MSETILAAWIQALGARHDEDGYSDESAMHYAINLTRQTMEEWDALADTSPASQERDVQDAVAREIERWEALAATAKAAEITVPRRAAEISIQALQGLLARLRSGSEPGGRIGGTALMDARVYAGLSRRGLADELGLSDLELGEFERGEVPADRWLRCVLVRLRDHMGLARQVDAYLATLDDDEPAARPSGGEGAHDWEMVGEGDRYNSSHCCRKCGEYADKEVGNGPCRGEGAPEPDALRELVAVLTAHRACTGTEHDPANGKIHGYCVVCGVPWPCEYVGLPPEREACSSCTEGQPPFFCRECVHRREEGLREALEREAEAREPDAMTYTKDPRRYLAEWSEVLAVRRFDPEKCKTDGSGPPWPVFFGTPGPDREAEIRADERRKVLEETKGEDPTWYADDSPPGTDPNVFVAGVRFGLDLVTEALARLSPTDEQDSPNRSDEP